MLTLINDDDDLVTELSVFLQDEIDIKYSMKQWTTLPCQTWTKVHMLL